MSTKLDLVGVGTPSMDILHTESGLMGRFGGSVATAVIALSRWGFRTGLIGRIGNDYYGKRLLEDFVANNVDVSRLRADEGLTSIWHIRVAQDEREILYAEYYKPLERLSREDIDHVKNSDSVFIRFNNPLFKSVSTAARKYGKKMFVTFHLFTSSAKDEESLKILDKCKPKIVFMSEEEAEKGGEIFEKLTENHLVAVTRGKKGCSVYKDGNGTDYPSIKVKTVDLTGAGDAFAAGFIYGYMNGWPVDKTARFANVVGAMVTMDYGARTKIPTSDEAFDLIELSGHA